MESYLHTQWNFGFSLCSTIESCSSACQILMFYLTVPVMLYQSLCTKSDVNWCFLKCVLTMGCLFFNKLLYLCSKLVKKRKHCHNAIIVCYDIFSIYTFIKLLDPVTHTHSQNEVLVLLNFQNCKATNLNTVLLNTERKTPVFLL